MEDNTIHLQKSLEHFRQQRQQLLQKLRDTEAMIRGLESDLGETSSLDAPDVGESGGTLANPTPLVKVRPMPTSIRPDEFFNMSQGDAAKAYLRKVGHAVPLDELV